MNELIAQRFGEMTTPQMVFLGGMIILVGLLLSRSRSYFRKKAREPRAVPRTGQPTPARPLHTEKPGEMQRWEVEMEELARELTARLDNKIVLLEQIIRDADAATVKLQAALAQIETPPQSSPRMPTTPGAVRRPLETSEPPDAFHGAYAPAPSEDPRYRAIYALADQGLSREVIARRVGTPAGEVDLILSLRGKK